VSTLEIGSRGDIFCFWGNLRFYAELRREFGWGNFDLVFLEDLFVGPRRGWEEGGPFSVPLSDLGESG
jgi:hypothetical protein